MKNISVLGSTGSIGRSSLEVIDKLSHRFKVVGLTAGRNTQLLEKQVEKFRPKIVSLERKEEAEDLRRKFRGKSIKVTFAQEGAEEVASFSENDIVISAITGINGLRPTLAAVQEGKKVALANKESMVVAGPLIQDMIRKFGAQLIPVDSEHSGVFQCLAKEEMENVKKVILTASGGPFFSKSSSEMNDITLEEALNHPRWKMGKKVTIDSATLMNKGLELIEARWLFGLEPRQLGILIHPQSIVHSLVEMSDGSVLAQLSPTDMKLPIQYALTYPEREDSLLPSLDLSEIKALEFYEVNVEKFPIIKLARLALEEGESFPIALNAANEVVVSAFLEQRIKFMDISDVVTEIVENHQKRKAQSLEDIFDVDRETRRVSLDLLKKRS
ncbi:MAG: 1-deoxy-D-xylulose-5-phosphate reductoisomerase [Candidatus Aminicenantes bacterium]|nr:MAG: 1-deoxy-D-xylulose-5-phosphate reductoisomerase [Candidatus Aminicenantes bacterium]